jgi:hypothetical protein
MPVARKVWFPILVLMPGVGRAALNHPVGGLLPHPMLLARLAAGRAEQRPVWIAGDAGRRDVFIEVLFQLA